MSSANPVKIRRGIGTYSLRSLFLVVMAVAILASLARIHPFYAIVVGIIGCAVLASLLAFSRYAVTGYGFFRTMLGGAFGGFLSTMAVLIGWIAISFLMAFVADSWPQVDQPFATHAEILALAFISYGAASLFVGACVGMLSWLVLRFCQLDV